jgi:hypothetical protein
MKRILFILSITLIVFLSGCQTDGYEDPKDLTQAYYDALTTVLQGDELNTKEVCKSLALPENQSECSEFYTAMMEYYSDSTIDEWSITITEFQIDKIESEEFNLDTDVYEAVFKYDQYVVENGIQNNDANSHTVSLNLTKKGDYFYVVGFLEDQVQ